MKLIKRITFGNDDFLSCYKIKLNKYSVLEIKKNLIKIKGSN